VQLGQLVAGRGGRRGSRGSEQEASGEENVFQHGGAPG